MSGDCLRRAPAWRGYRGKEGEVAFTLIELLVVIGVIAVLSSLLLPALAKSAGIGKQAVCSSNLRNLQAAYLLYLSDHDNKFFPYQDDDLVDGKRVYYFGLSANGAEGTRTLDMSYAKLAPYLANGGGVEVCPAMPYNAPYFKQKYAIASYGYGINAFLLAGSDKCNQAGITNYGSITKPSETIAWGDCAQIDQFLAPASPQHPMLEEWYRLDNSPLYNFHFRHNVRVNVILADGSVKSLPAYHLDERCDGLTGTLEPKLRDYLLSTSK